jgi:hypothetical protein
MLKIAHIINPVKVPETSDLFTAQPITFRTMKTAQELAVQQGLDVTLWTTQFPEDKPIVPDYFLETNDLDRSMLDVGDFEVKRKLPLMGDILDRLYEASDADYFIYTNVDIALLPHFYLAVARIIETGYDAFVINRRTISRKFQDIQDIPLMYSRMGITHQGYDCFVFKRAIYPKYKLGLACIGMVHVGRVLIYNLAAYATQFKIFEDEHLTFHIGDDGSWFASKYLDYEQHNRAEMLKVLNLLEAEGFDKTVIPGSYFKVEGESMLDKISRKVTSLWPGKS